MGLSAAQNWGLGVFATQALRPPTCARVRLHAARANHAGPLRVGTRVWGKNVKRLKRENSEWFTSCRRSRHADARDKPGSPVRFFVRLRLRTHRFFRVIL